MHNWKFKEGDILVYKGRKYKIIGRIPNPSLPKYLLSQLYVYGILGESYLDSISNVESNYKKCLTTLFSKL